MIFYDSHKSILGSNQGSLSYSDSGGHDAFTDSGQDFTEWAKAVGDCTYKIIVTNGDDSVSEGYLGELGDGTVEVVVYQDYNKSAYGWAVDNSAQTPISYTITKIVKSFRTFNKLDSENFNETVVRPIYFVYLDFLDDVGNPDPLYVNSSMMDIVFDGNTYLGVGHLGTIEQITEGEEFQVYGTKLTLNGVPRSMLNYPFKTQYRDRDCIIYLGIIDDNFAIVQHPVSGSDLVNMIFRGTIDKIETEIIGNQSISVFVENAAIDWERPRSERYTNETQQRLYPSDLGLEFVKDMVEKEILWGPTA